MVKKCIVTVGMVVIGCSLLMGGYYFGLGQSSELEELRLSLRGINLSGGAYNDFLDSSLRYLLIGLCVVTSHLVFLSKKKFVIAFVCLPVLLLSTLQSIFIVRNKTDPAIAVGSVLLRQCIIVFWYVDFLVPIFLLCLTALYVFFLLKGPSTKNGMSRFWKRPNNC